MWQVAVYVVSTDAKQNIGRGGYVQSVFFAEGVSKLAGGRDLQVCQHFKRDHVSAESSHEGGVVALRNPYTTPSAGPVNLKYWRLNS